MSEPLLLLQQIAGQLIKEGKTPSLALFKSRLGGQISAPALFSAYQQWKRQPDVVIAEQPADEAGNSTEITVPKPTPALSDLAAQLNRIEMKLDHLLAQIKP